VLGRVEPANILVAAGDSFDGQRSVCVSRDGAVFDAVVETGGVADEVSGEEAAHYLGEGFAALTGLGVTGVPFLI